MTDEQSQYIDSILLDWHLWASHQESAQAYPSRAAGMESYRCSRQYDDTNGALDTDLDHRMLKTVQFNVEQMVQPFQTAIYVNARNLATGAAVWSHPRLPADREGRHAVVMEAREIFRKKMLALGVI